MKANIKRVAFYHDRNMDRKHPATWQIGYDYPATVAQIRSDCAGNNAVLDAIYRTDTGKLTVYTKRNTEEDYLANLPTID